MPIEELKEHEDVFKRELVTLPLIPDSSLTIRYRNGEVYMINFIAKEGGKGYSIADGTDCPIQSFIDLMREYFTEKSKTDKSIFNINMEPIDILKLELDKYTRALEKSKEFLDKGIISQEAHDVHTKNLTPKIESYKNAIKIIEYAK